ncbi:selenide, water dikinase SelD, partial [candidate division WOR-3 bacterium]|nr:selenide, water dikinase SelD [candidate division WOR-3 bacterium]
TADDAGVYLLQDGLALVQTVDLLTPMVEDPYTFGRIAATNSLSDVYAMGGTPLTVLNIVGFPGPMDKQVLAEILRGGQDAVAAAGAVVCGGHTFNEKEIKYGLSVTGRIDPEAIVTNAGAKPGHRLVLTKPLGTGVFAQAMMTQDTVDPALYEAATGSMMQLNRVAGEAMTGHGASAGTDITGYGLLGHAQEMAEGSGVRLAFSASALPVLPGALELVGSGLEDPGMLMNETSFGGKVGFGPGVDERRRRLMWESESSGGLLVALPPDRVEPYRRTLADRGVLAVVVGEVVKGPAGTVEVRI